MPAPVLAIVNAHVVPVTSPPFTGTLETGKDADVVLWSGDPLDVRQRALTVWIGGREVCRYDTETRTPVVAGHR